MTKHTRVNGDEAEEARDAVPQAADLSLTASGSSLRHSPSVEKIVDDLEDATNVRTDSMLSFEKDAITELLQTFPYSDTQGGPVSAAQALVNHCRNCRFRCTRSDDTWLTIGSSSGARLHCHTIVSVLA